jgi:hypothetical protein
MLDERRCPWCGGSAAAQSGAHPTDRPKAGDVSACYYCRRPSMFTASLGLRRPTEAEQAKLADDPRWQKAQAALAGPRGVMDAVALWRRLLSDPDPGAQ